MAIEIRRVRAGDGSLLRQVRLAALLDAPYAFASSHQEEHALVEAQWEQWAVERSSGPDAATWLAFVGPEPSGIVGAFREGGEPLHLVSMWTDPAQRGRGIGEQLVETVVDFAAGEEVRLWVTRGNDTAQRLYERCGFLVTTATRSLPSHPDEEEVRMRLPARP